MECPLDGELSGLYTENRIVDHSSPIIYKGIYKHAAELVDILNFGRTFFISVYKWVEIFVCDLFSN